jgi:hypothetical protein
MTTLGVLGDEKFLFTLPKVEFGESAYKVVHVKGARSRAHPVLLAYRYLREIL